MSFPVALTISAKPHILSFSPTCLTNSNSTRALMKLKVMKVQQFCTVMKSLFALLEWTWMNILDSIGLWFIPLQGIKEVTLLGQNVNSYRDMSDSQYYGNPCPSASTQLSPGFSTVYRNKSGGRRFSELLDRVSLVDPEMRIRFTSPHPKDFPDEVNQHTLQCHDCNIIIVNLI